MGNSLRCCIACILPCGALDVIRIVHLNGHIDEFSRPVMAHEVLSAHPGHMLSKPCSSAAGGVSGRILIVSPESELRRGSFYFLIPTVSVPDKKKKRKAHKASSTPKAHKPAVVEHDKNYLEEILSERKAGYRRKRSGRVGVWRPHLESISEDPIS